jgi:hypothetical protein
MDIVLMLHSVVRWLIILVAAIAVVKFTIGWRRGLAFSGMDRGLSSAFSGLMDAQVLLGFIYFFWTGFAAGVGFPAHRLEHMGIMLLAAVVAHLSALWKKADDKVRFRNTLFVVLDTIIIILIGVSRLPGGWSR